jgi:hypothetical protein
MRINCNQSIQPFLFAAVIGLLATGCKTYEQQNHVIQYWHQGNMTNAVVEATKMADKNANNKDAIIWRLEQGAVLRGAGKYEESNKAFDQAQDKIDQYAQKAKVRVGQEAGAMMSNQANLDYEGRAYDGIMLNTYKALNYLQLGEPDKARVELIRAYQRQQDAVEINKKRIEAAQAQATNTTTTTTDTTASGSQFKKRAHSPANTDATANAGVATTNNSAAVDKAQQDPKFQAQIQGVYAGLGNLKPYANYVNPFTVYLDGLFFMANAADASDLERAHKSLERVAEFAPDNNYVKQDLAAVDGVMQGKPLTPTTYVIFETGCAPVRDQIRIDIPVLLPRVPYVGAAFPTLKLQGNYLPSLTVTANSLMVTTNDAVTTVSSTTTTTNDAATATTGTSAATNDTVTTAGGTSTTTNDAVTTVSSTTTTTNDTTVTSGSMTTTTNGATVTASSTTTTADVTTATASSTTGTTSPIASMDSVIGLDFKNEMPIVITKTIASTIAKAVAAYAINQAAHQQGAIYEIIAMISTGIYQAAVNIADERTWTTLPKEFQVCRFPTPPDRKIVLETPNGTQKIPVTIEDGTINIVYVRSITATNALLVTQMKLK